MTYDDLVETVARAMHDTLAIRESVGPLDSQSEEYQASVRMQARAAITIIRPRCWRRWRDASPMTDKPIIFSAPMIRALISGRKTQTRRTILPTKKQQRWNANFKICPAARIKDNFVCFEHPSGGPYTSTPLSYTIGNRLWAREAFVVGYDIDDLTDKPGVTKRIWYRADPKWPLWYDADSETTVDTPPWRPAIHMPRHASRLTLTVTDVRVQRLQDISEEDALAEGVSKIHHGDGDYYYSAFRNDPHPTNWCCPKDAFRELWESINGPGAWDENPWVAVYNFSAEARNIDDLRKPGDAPPAL